MDYPPGQCFFHYTTRDAAFGQILPARQLRFSTYERMRDPLENRDWRFTGAWFVDPTETPNSAEKAFFTFNHYAQEIRHKARLLAMTVDAPGATEIDHFARGWARARMWEHYAEKHAGVCLVFDRQRLISNLSRSVREQCEVSPYHRPVEYTETGTADLTLNLGSPDEFSTAAKVARYIEDHNDELFFLKTLDWETEFEYRFVTTTESDDDLFVDYGDALEAVIVGEKFPHWERPAAIEACNNAAAEALRLDWSMHRPIPAKLKAAKAEPPPTSANDRVEPGQAPPQDHPPHSPAP